MSALPRIICVGDVDVDDMIAVDALPQADGKVNGRELGRTPGGMAANVAVGIARLGGCATLIGRVGDDEVGDFVLARIAAEGVDVAAVARSAGSQTFRCLVLLTPDGEKGLIRLPTRAYLPAPAEIGATALSGAAHVHLTFGNPVLAEHVLRLARAAGIATSIDIELADLPADHTALAKVLEQVDLLFVNRRSREALPVHLTSGGAPTAVVTTLGAAGSRFEAPGERIEAPGFAVNVRDTTGAGDAFAAAFLVARSRSGMTNAAALEFANAAAALSTQAVGAQTALPRMAEVDALLATVGRRERV
jgi:sugar/nucleoside kinase (ribokinase family)